ncbi:MAG: hypothetical protein QM723_20945 [Myxococcaceae bacterium]
MKRSFFAVATLALSACIGAATQDEHHDQPQPSDKAITSFALRQADNAALTADALGTITGTNIAIAVPAGTSVTHLTPAIVQSGASISPVSGAAQDFTNPVAYTVSAADGSKQTYTVTVTPGMVTLSSTKDITAFSINGIAGTINGSGITLTVPNGTSRANLTPTIAINGASLIPASGEARDFTNPVTYLVTAQDGSSKTYTVTVSEAPSSSKEITSFTINGVSGGINGTSISLTLPVGTNAASLTPQIAHTGASINPPSGAAHDFTNPVTYTVTAADGSTRDYQVSVTVQQPAMINLANVTITDGSAGDVASWAQTTTITAVNIVDGAFEVDFDKKDGPNRWPDECDLPGFAPDCLQYSIWVFEYVGGQWYGTGAIEMWYGRADTGAEPAGWTVEQQIQGNWIYYSGAMGSHVLVPGEQIGIMVTTGDERLKNNADLHERSDVFVVTLP